MQVTEGMVGVVEDRSRHPYPWGAGSGSMGEWLKAHGYRDVGELERAMAVLDRLVWAWCTEPGEVGRRANSIRDERGGLVGYEFVTSLGSSVRLMLPSS
jgi:hypothetical protein